MLKASNSTQQCTMTHLNVFFFLKKKNFVINKRRVLFIIIVKKVKNKSWREAPEIIKI